MRHTLRKFAGAASSILAAIGVVLTLAYRAAKPTAEASEYLRLPNDLREAIVNIASFAPIIDYSLLTIGGLALGFLILDRFIPRNIVALARPAEPISSSTSLWPQGSALLHKWPDEIDRKNLHAALRDVSMLLTDDVSPKQLEVHRLTNDIPTSLQSVDRLADISEQFTAIRNMLIDRFAHGKMYTDEIWDVLGGSEPLGAEVIYINQYIPALRAKPTGALVGLLAPLSEQVRNANFATGNWVGESMARLRRKQEALDN